MTDKNKILEDVRNLLEYAKSLGMTEVQNRGSGIGDRGAEKTEAGGKKPEAGETKKPTNVTEKQPGLDAVRKEIGDCTRCKLCNGRKNIVFGVGNPNADLMFIGEGPGAEEDIQGIPFVGRAGQLLTKIIEAMKLNRDQVYIANIVECRPPGNRNPEPDEVSTCIPFLIKQVEIVEPKVIVCLGSVATQNLLGTEEKITKLRGKFTKWQNVPVMPTYHPAFLLRNPAMKKPVWEDMQEVMKFLKNP